MRMGDIQKYLQFVARNAKDYKKLNKQLVISEIAGFFAGFLVTEMALASPALLYNSSNGEWLVSILSTVADYAAAIVGFLVIFYYDNKPSLTEFSTFARVRKVSRMALDLWPSVVSADIVFLLVRPYMQFLLLSNNIDVGVTSAVAHFVAFGAFNLVAVLSKSVFDFYYHSKSVKSTGP